MGIDVYFTLERRVPDRATRSATETLSSIAPHCALPTDVVQHCATQMSVTHEWLPVRFHSWLALPDSEFAASVSTFYEVRAASILSAVIGRRVAPDESAPSLWHLLSSSDWKTAAVDANLDDDEIDESATADALLAVGMLSDDGTTHAEELFDVFKVRERSYSKFALFSRAIGQARAAREQIVPLPCMVDGIPRDPKRFTKWLARQMVGGVSGSQTALESCKPHPSYLHEQPGAKHCFCCLNALLETDWNEVCDATGRTRRQIMGGKVVDEFDRLGKEIGDAGFSLRDFRLLISFD